MVQKLKHTGTEESKKKLKGGTDNWQNSEICLWARKKTGLI